MIDAVKNFDQYGLRARLFPALIAGLPSMAFLFMLVSWGSLGLPHAVASLVCAILLFAFADIARRAGRHIEARLGTRATPELFHFHDPTIDEVSKSRYRGFLAGKIGKVPPTAEDETVDIKRANEFYLSAGVWLREHTRDTKKFNILFNENITYGFRRNLRGLRSVALSLNTVVIASSVAILYFRWPYFITIDNIDAKLLIVVVAALIHSAYMMLGVSDQSVVDASKIYGRQLILSTEAFMVASKAPAAARRGKSPKEK